MLKKRLPSNTTIQRTGGWVASLGLIALGFVKLFVTADLNLAIGLWTAGGTFVLIVEGMIANNIAATEHAMHNCSADECPVLGRRAA